MRDVLCVIDIKHHQNQMKKFLLETIKRLPKMYFTNITGGEPFIRTDLKDIVKRII